MLYRFKSKAAGDVVMLEPNGKQVLEILGKDPAHPGIILPEQMPAAIQALRDGGAGTASTAFRLQRHFECWWIRY